MPDPVVPIEGEVSADAAALNAKIETELGLPPQEVEEASGDESTAADADSTEDSSDAGDNSGDESEEVTEESEEDGEASAEETDAGESASNKPSNPDLFIEVEDADGVKHKITKIEDLPEDFSPKNNRQGLEILVQLQKLEQKQTAADELAKTQAQEAEFNKSKQEQFDSWDKEITEIAKTKRVDVKDTDRINAIFEHMNAINAARTKAGNPNLISSFEDALDKFEAKEASDKAELDKKNDNATAKAKAALIGRGSAAANDSNFVYKAGSYANIDDVPLD